MKQKTINLIEIAIILIIMIIALFYKFIPEYKNNKGSSDTYINIEKYVDLVEFKINNKTNFILVTDKKNITNIIFLDKTSLVLYNKLIEDNDIKTSINFLIDNLIRTKTLKQNDILILTNYNNKTYLDIKTAVENELIEYNTTVIIQEEKTTLEKRGKELGITAQSNEEVLKQLEIYSKDLIRHKKNDVTLDTSTTTIKDEALTEESSKKYSDIIYKKLEEFVENNNIINQNKDEVTLPITIIPANSNGTLFPDEESYYRIENKKSMLI